MVRQWQESFYDERYSASSMLNGEPDFIKLANSFGIEGYRITNRKDLVDCLNSVMNSESPGLVDIHVRSNENCYPMVPPGKSNAQMVGVNSISKIDNYKSLM